MQTFLPQPDFQYCADVLDTLRRWKQVVESRQILNTLTGVSKGWKSHPAVLMWVGYVPALMQYSNFMLCKVLELKTHKVVAYQPFDMIGKLRNPKMPPWMGKKKLHASHRSKLLEKDFDHYSQFGWKEKPGLEYYWPVTVKKGK